MRLPLGALLPLGVATCLRTPPLVLAVENHASGETVRYPVVLLRGRVAAEEGAELVVRDSDSTRPGMVTHVHGGRFKVLVELVPGENHLEIAAGGARTSLPLTYAPPTNPARVRFSWIVGSDGDATYASEDADQDFRARIDTAAKLLQTFTAESLADAGLPRRTFGLELDGDGRVIVHVVKAPLSGDAYRAYADDYQLNSELGAVVKAALPEGPYKDVALMAFSRWDPVAKKARAHTALGGGDFGLFGSAGVYTWPSTLAGVEAAFSDARPLGAAMFDDSNGRSTRWAVAATTLGAVLHETGHTLGLPHTDNPGDIMNRGFDHLNRMFTLVEPPSARVSNEVVFPDADVATWGPVSEPRIAWHPFLLPDPAGSSTPTLAVDKARGVVTVDAPAGVRVVGVDTYKTARHSEVRPDGPRHLELPLADLAARAGSRVFSLVVLDDQGGHATLGPDALSDPADFVRTWRFSPDAVPWEGEPALPTWSPDQLATLAASAGAPRTSPDARVDLVPLFPESTWRIAFAWTRFRVEEGRTLRLLAGSDDTLRVRLDGEVVLTRPEFSAAEPDQAEAEVALAAGEHALGVEVGNGGWDWAFYLRLADGEGRPWTIGEDGVLRAK